MFNTNFNFSIFIARHECATTFPITTSSPTKHSSSIASRFLPTPWGVIKKYQDDALENIKMKLRSCEIKEVWFLWEKWKLSSPPNLLWYTTSLLAWASGSFSFLFFFSLAVCHYKSYSAFAYWEVSSGHTLAYIHTCEAYNNNFEWQLKRSDGGKAPEGELLGLLKRNFGSYDLFVMLFKQACATQFGPLWVMHELLSSHSIANDTRNVKSMFQCIHTKISYQLLSYHYGPVSGMASTYLWIPGHHPQYSEPITRHCRSTPWCRQLEPWGGCLKNKDTNGQRLLFMDVQCTWSVHQLFPHLQDIIGKYRQIFEGHSVPSSTWEPCFSFIDVNAILLMFKLFFFH